MAIKILTDAQMSELLTKRHEGRVDDENAIYKLTDDHSAVLDNEFLYKNKAKITKDITTKRLSVVLDTRAIMELEQGSVGMEQIPVYNFVLTGNGPHYQGIDVISKSVFASEYTQILPPDNVRALQVLIEEGSDKHKAYTAAF